MFRFGVFPFFDLGLTVPMQCAAHQPLDGCVNCVKKNSLSHTHVQAHTHGRTHAHTHTHTNTHTHTHQLVNVIMSIVNSCELKKPLVCSMVNIFAYIII